MSVPIVVLNDESVLLEAYSDFTCLPQMFPDRVFVSRVSYPFLYSQKYSKLSQ